jgi:transposase
MYQNFIGIDISKDTFAAAAHTSKDSHTFSNDQAGFKSFIKAYKPFLSQALIVLETTGGYELQQVRYLQEENLAVHRANTRKVKHFIKSFGILGKSDYIDAQGLAQYGAERHAKLEIFIENPRKMLQKLVERREDLKKMLVQEKNRLQSPDQKELSKSFKAIISALNSQLKSIENDIEKYCKNHPDLEKKRKVLETVSGIGKTISAQLIALLPELGTIDRKKIASLAGLAPHPYESGKKIGYRSTRGGRDNVKKVLFMAALTASRSKSALGDFYNRLVSAGKKKMVALVALMRKILVVANARMKEYEQSQHFIQHG